MDTQKVVDHFGSRRKVAEALGISVQAVHEWGETVPKLRAYELERLTAGVLAVDDAPEPLVEEDAPTGDSGPSGKAA